MKKILFNTAFLCLCLAVSQCSNSQLVINELSAGNYSDHLDNYGQFEDWFEIYNAGAVAVDIDGYYFSDDILEPEKWQVPSSLIVPAGGYCMIYCSKRDEVSGGVGHTSYKITQTRNEYVVMSDPTVNIVDLFWIEIPNKANHSYGRNIDGGGVWEVFTNPSPNAANGGGVAGYSITPVIDLEAGYYPGPINISITSPSPDTEIRYTLDGSEPTNLSTLYTGPINIGTTTVVKAAAFSTSGLLLSSHTETNTYFIDTDQHSVYIVSIAGDDIMNLLGPTGGPGPEPIISFELFGPNGAFLTESTGDSNEHGNDSNAYGQRGFDYIARDQYGVKNALYHTIFRDKSRDEYQRVIMKAAANDNYNFQGGGAHIRDSYIHSLSQVADLRMDERSFESAVLYINGEYWGLYDIREKVDDTDFTDYYYDQPKGQIDFIKTWGGTWYEYDSGTANEWDDLVNFITTNDMTNPANYDYVKGILNVGSLIDYMVLNSYVVSSDWLNWNTAWWRGRNPDGDKKKWRYILWDLDATFGHYANYTGIPNQNPDANPCDPESFGDPGGQGHIPILNALLTNDDFWQSYLTRYADLSNSYFTCDHMIHHLDSLIGMIDPEMPRQIDRWNDGGDSYAGWQSNVQDLRDYILERCALINNSMVDCYDIEGPFDLTIMIEPPGAGEVEFNSLDITTTPWNGEYFGNLIVDLEATPYGSNFFDHWELNNHTIPNNFVDTAQFVFQMPDTIIAYFSGALTDVTLKVEPENAGYIELGGITFTDFPAQSQQSENVNLSLQASSSGPEYTFSHWEVDLTAQIDDDFDPSTQVMFSGPDCVTAVFDEVEHYEVTYIVRPEEAGRIAQNGVSISDYPRTETYYAPNLDLNLSALVGQYHDFSHWEVLHNELVPDEKSTEISIELMQDDTVIAHFTPYQYSFYLPNSFSPNGDGFNDIFKPEGFAYQLDNYKMEIFDRWGQLVFESNEIEDGWDGAGVGNSNYYADANVYIYKVQVQALFEIAPREYVGSVMVIR